ncbi:hypothetical protein DPMN_184737 [Dreissena polymorpha]|uniref:Uncharacterized protein n=1 Tax=Dreissena polymorpha TaxID=45954 RepID=A0A9D4I7P3_DREPO|nr:hypothetical protein DPMN_184737 [Dreissena polymorpha]
MKLVYILVFVVEVHGGLIQLQVRFQCGHDLLTLGVRCGLPAKRFLLIVEILNLSSA